MTAAFYCYEDRANGMKPLCGSANGKTRSPMAWWRLPSGRRCAQCEAALEARGQVTP